MAVADLPEGSFEHMRSAFAPHPEVRVRLALEQVIIEAANPGTSGGSTCSITVLSADPDEVVFDVGHTHIVTTAARRSGLQVLFADPIFWAHAARLGQVQETIWWRGTGVVKAKARGWLGAKTQRAISSVPHIPLKVTKHSVEYEPYPPV